MKEKSFSKINICRDLCIFTTYIILILFFSLIGKEIAVDTTNLTLQIRQGLWAVGTFPITSGGQDSPTLRGEFMVLDKIEDVDSYHGYTFPHWLGVYMVGGYENGIHSVKEQNPWAKNIAQYNCTPGSIILKKSDMEQVFNWAKVGTRITITE